MTETEWLACTAPRAVVEFLRSKRMASHRKARLLGVALCRHISALLPSEESRKAIEVVERYVEGEVMSVELALAERAAWDSAKDAWAYGRSAAGDLARAVAAAASLDTEYDRSAVVMAWDPLIIIIRSTARAQLRTAGEPDAPCQWQLDIIRDMFVNPIRTLPIISPSCLTWNDGTVTRLARAIYKERAFDRMPILADALEEAGCSDPDILNHCRKLGEHVRGCWLIDALLGKT